MKHIRLIPILLLILSCNTKASEENKKGERTEDEYKTEHFNVTISSDLSNRLNQKLYPKAVSDVDIVDIIAESIYPKILNHKRSMNQLDVFRIGFINKKQINAYNVDTKFMNIDFSEFKTQAERIAYLRKYFQNDKRRFVNEFKKLHGQAIKKPFGSDIWTYMQQGVDDFVVNKEIGEGKIGNTTFKNKRRNILILLTDGYIETVFNNNAYDLTGEEINTFRKEYLQTGETSIDSFLQKNPKYKIQPLTNPLLEDLEVLVLELYDRSDTNAGASVHPTDLEIMKVIWGDWLKCSNVKHWELYPKSSSKSETEKIILRFLGI
ncbi:hypothetical protein [Sphingobacterium spiritivorum]|uniref:hypothetical protein n=1 Tax=Sphingobacterium spiritivorum TaxID=258 RepID=UPI0019182F89|nr:hypothetical protein [Sphingobacterium spiritivorum]QQT26772.1 hypothetical protein I6J02_02605 [Sphingobacterium spiritivorum]